MTLRCITCGRDCFCARSVNIPLIQPLPTFKREEVTEGSTMKIMNNTPLMIAIEGLNQQIVELIIPKLDKIGINAKNSKGRTALHCVANIVWFDSRWQVDDKRFNQAKIAKLLIDAGADINIQDDEGITPLHLACRSNSYELVQLLIDNGANVNPPPKEPGICHLCHLIDIGAIEVERLDAELRAYLHMDLPKYPTKEELEKLGCKVYDDK